MRVPFNGNYGITQRFNDSCCRASYAKFGMTGHNGIDYGLPCGTPVVAPISGTISYFSDPSGYGNAVFIRGEGVEVVLGHLSEVSRKSGNISEGEQLGRSGTTGNSTGCHLHFGVRTYPGYDRNNGFYGYTDPQQYLNKGGDVPTLATRDQVAILYRTILGREPDPGGWNAFTGQPLDKVVNELSSSPERQDYVQYLIKKAYNGYLQRDPDPSGIKTYTPQPMRNFLDSISTSEEAATISNKVKGYDPLLKENAELRKKLSESTGGVDQQTKDDIGYIKATVQWIKDKWPFK